MFNKNQNNMGPGVDFLPGGPVRQGRRLVATLSVALIVVSGLAGYFLFLNKKKNKMWPFLH